ncbi:hypothetical protein EKK58_08715 [Candidatus Dependentiae bacterium]|nr:MAG: hypothetical protein EKK58_08715 [Candidatus Dependentiae bacterium]
MNIVEIRQDSVEWHSWRSKGIGASEAPVIMFDSPWKTLDDLWQEKVYGVSLTKQNFAMKRGKKLEAVARDIYEQQFKVSVPPITAACSRFPFILASLDGFHERHKYVVEIKCPLNENEIEIAKKGILTPKYYAQIQQQLYVTNGSYCDFVTFDGYSSISVIKVYPHYTYQRELVRRLRWFWHQVENKIPLKKRKVGFFHV